MPTMFLRRRLLIRFLGRLFFSNFSVLALLLLMQAHILAHYWLLPEVEENPIFSQRTNSSSCGQEEEMAYGWRIRDTATGRLDMGRGRPFHCRLVPMLRKFSLSDRSPVSPKFIARPPGHLKGGPVFVTATNLRYYQSLRGLIASIKRTFGRRQPIVVYDLGGIRTNLVMMNELGRVCNVEVRPFDFSLLPPGVRRMKTFAWKVLILAQSYAEFPLFIYCDTSVNFVSRDYTKHFRMINSGQVSPFLFMQGTFHGIKHATLHETFDYLPLFSSNQNDIEMQEANFIVVKRSQFARRMLKWALLCALTPECIEPRWVPWDCPETIFHTNRHFGICHRMDQSAMSILIHNAEAEAVSNGNRRLIRHFDFEHPSHRLINHILVREQSTQEAIARLYKC